MNIDIIEFSNSRYKIHGYKSPQVFYLVVYSITLYNSLKYKYLFLSIITSSLSLKSIITLYRKVDGSPFQPFDTLA